jgi:hypothetical protein
MGEHLSRSSHKPQEDSGQTPVQLEVKRWRKLATTNKAYLFELLETLTGVIAQHEALLEDFLTLDSLHKEALGQLTETVDSRNRLRTQLEESNAAVSEQRAGNDLLRGELAEVKRRLKALDD